MYWNLTILDNSYLLKKNVHSLTWLTTIDHNNNKLTIALPDYTIVNQSLLISNIQWPYQKLPQHYACYYDLKTGHAFFKSRISNQKHNSNFINRVMLIVIGEPHPHAWHLHFVCDLLSSGCTPMCDIIHRIDNAYYVMSHDLSCTTIFWIWGNLTYIHDIKSFPRVLYFLTFYKNVGC